ncbi:haloacid dehalogenase type II [Phenylobacterium sp.]|uniref:haloacid dehalogenase type II n=1 Tax=Phenylobacterium sp. TaxID=1871053 RepID=UPI0025DA660E|nr:haloacid dehalogenase type II [Phenylobacterium sp.]
MTTAGSHDRNRRELLRAGAVGLTAAPLISAAARAPRSAPIGAVAFDAFAIFDPNAVFAAAAAGYPEQDAKFWRAWFQALFADTWLRTSAHRYRPFIDVAASRLDRACQTVNLAPRPHARDQVLEAFSTLTVWPDVADQLGGLRACGLRLALLSNLSQPTQRANIRRNGLDGLFETALSTDLVRAFKPAPAAYALAMSAFGLPKRDIGFAAFAPWDAAGAAWFGYPTAWVNRQAQPAEPDAPAVLIGRDLNIVLQLARRTV